MKRFLLIALAVSVGLFAQESRSSNVSKRGEAAGDSTREASVLSMMGWGIGLIVGIATLFSLLDNNSAHAH